MYRFIKRSFDLICSIIGLPFFLLMAIPISIAIKLSDGGPIFYKAARIGRKCKRFEMLKFRSMQVNALNILNADGSTYNAKNDPRVTKIGRFLREISLDETPQMLNIIKGDMSFIGPRASNWDALPSYQPDELAKMDVRPGVTGYTQAYFRNSITVREKRLYDAWYAAHASVWLDIKIFFKTVATVLLHKNIYTNTAEVERSTVKDEEQTSIQR